MASENLTELETTEAAVLQPSKSVDDQLIDELVAGPGPRNSS
ncbi:MULTISPECIES: hypothetical protein [unclassified Streptomyces]|nr:hypothetical protein [Streptomyces sp. NBC_00063]MCX5442922.1 hypothetical protein [Streptomyces sp. NBC_00063]